MDRRLFNQDLWHRWGINPPRQGMQKDVAGLRHYLTPTYSNFFLTTNVFFTSSRFYSSFYSCPPCIFWSPCSFGASSSPVLLLWCLLILPLLLFFLTLLPSLLLLLLLLLHLLLLFFLLLLILLLRLPIRLPLDLLLLFPHPTPPNPICSSYLTYLFLPAGSTNSGVREPIFIAILIGKP